MKPILVLTHTNAGVAALRGRLEKAGVKPAGYRAATLDGFAIRLISTLMTPRQIRGVLSQESLGPSEPPPAPNWRTAIRSSSIARSAAASFTATIRSCRPASARNVPSTSSECLTNETR